MGDGGTPPIQPGRVLAKRLRLETKLASGSMGEVWRARHLGLDKDVAVKILRRDHRLDDQISQRFIREAQTASRLDHPSSVSILDFGRDDETGLLYLAMELIAGRTLFQALNERGPLPFDEARDIMVKVLAAVAAAHAVGVLHRDIKPSNIMLTDAEDDDGQPITQVKVCDFGLAKLVDSTESLVNAKGQKVIVGTPMYMSPEQAVGGEVDERSDVYACGVVFFEMITGQPPYVADQPVQVLMQHCSSPIPRATELVPELPPEVDVLIARAMAKEATDRLSSARAFRATLLDLGRPGALAEEASAGTGEHPRVPRSGSRVGPLPPFGPGLAAPQADDDLVKIESPVEAPPELVGLANSAITTPDALFASSLYQTAATDLGPPTPEPIVDEARSPRDTIPGTFDREATTGLVARKLTPVDLPGRRELSVGQPITRVPELEGLEPEAESIIPSPRVREEDTDDVSANAMYLWERYALSPHRRPPAIGFHLLVGAEELVGPLTFDELCVALRLECHDGQLERSRVAVEPAVDEDWHPATEFLAEIDAVGVGRLKADVAEVEGTARGALELELVPALLLRAELAGMTGRLLFESTEKGETVFFEVHLVEGAPTHIETNDLPAQSPSVWIGRGAIGEEDLARVVREAWSRGESVRAEARRLLGIDLEDQREAVMRRRLRRLLNVGSGTWVFDADFEPFERRPFLSSVAGMLPRLVREGLSEATLREALRPHVALVLETLPGVRFLLDHLGFSSAERTLAEELVAAGLVRDALPAEPELWRPRAALVFALIACSRLLPSELALESLDDEPS